MTAEETDEWLRKGKFNSAPSKSHVEKKYDHELKFESGTVHELLKKRILTATGLNGFKIGASLKYRIDHYVAYIEGTNGKSLQLRCDTALVKQKVDIRFTICGRFMHVFEIKKIKNFSFRVLRHRYHRRRRRWSGSRQESSFS